MATKKKPAPSAQSAVVKKPGVSRKLVAELKNLLKDQKGIEVLGHIESPALCCSGGTVAVVKIDRGDPAP
jgi:hypothetical protein